MTALTRVSLRGGSRDRHNVNHICEILASRGQNSQFIASVPRARSVVWQTRRRAWRQRRLRQCRRPLSFFRGEGNFTRRLKFKVSRVFGLFSAGVLLSAAVPRRLRASSCDHAWLRSRPLTRIRENEARESEIESAETAREKKSLSLSLFLFCLLAPSLSRTIRNACAAARAFAPVLHRTLTLRYRRRLAATTLSHFGLSHLFRRTLSPCYASLSHPLSLRSFSL